MTGPGLRSGWSSIASAWSTVALVPRARHHVLADVAARRGDASRLAGWMVAGPSSLLLAFLVLQAFAWWDLIAASVEITDHLYAWTVYVLTALHALHVLGGIGPMAWVVAGVPSGVHGRESSGCDPTSVSTGTSSTSPGSGSTRRWRRGSDEGPPALVRGPAGDRSLWWQAIEADHPRRPLAGDRSLVAVTHGTATRGGCRDRLRGPAGRGVHVHRDRSGPSRGSRRRGWRPGMLGRGRPPAARRSEVRWSSWSSRRGLDTAGELSFHAGAMDRSATLVVPHRIVRRHRPGPRGRPRDSVVGRPYQSFVRLPLAGGRRRSDSRWRVRRGTGLLVDDLVLVTPRHRCWSPPAVPVEDGVPVLRGRESSPLARLAIDVDGDLDPIAILTLEIDLDGTTDREDVERSSSGSALRGTMHARASGGDVARNFR